MAELLRKFAVNISDVTRNVYADVEVRIAQHPSETIRSLTLRMLARALEHDDGLQFSAGVSDGDNPAIALRDLTGKLTGWIDVGLPSPDRMHKATKQAARVAVYGSHRLQELVDDLHAQKVFRVAEIDMVFFEAAFLDQLAATIDRNNTWAVSRNDDDVYVEANGTSLSTTLRHLRAKESS
jgi:uncharacterized protein YaeQ